MFSFARLGSRALINSKCEQHGGVPGHLVGLVGILDSTTDIAQQMVVIVQIEAPSDADARHRGRAACSGLMEQFGTDLKLGQELIGDNAARLAEVGGAELADRASAAAERGPSAVPVLLNPNRQQQRRVIVTNEVRIAGKEDAREDADIEPEPILMK